MDPGPSKNIMNPKSFQSFDVPRVERESRKVRNPVFWFFWFFLVPPEVHPLAHGVRSTTFPAESVPWEFTPIARRSRGHPADIPRKSRGIKSADL